MARTDPDQPRKLDVYVSDVLRDKILTGELEPGQHVIEAKIASDLAVSAGTVRAGFRALRNEGLLTYYPNRGVYVATMTAEDAFEVYSLRNYLEALASRLAAERIDSAGRRNLKQVMATLVEAVRRGGRAEVIRADIGLHCEIVELSGHARLHELYAAIRSQSILFMNMTEHLHQNREEIITIHESLVDAIDRGDPARAEALAISHNTTDGEMLQGLLGSRERTVS